MKKYRRRSVDPTTKVAKVTTAEWIQIGGIAIGLLAVGSVLLQIRTMNKQLRLQLYADYTKRYQNITLNFPEDINARDFSFTGRADYNQTMRNMRVYFDLCYEEWHLHHEMDLLPEELWQSWEPGIETALSKPAFQQAWVIVKDSSGYGDGFENFMDSLMESHSQRARG